MDLDICQKKSGSPLLFKLLGFSIAHSFLQNGPPFPNLTNWIFEALVQSNEDVACSQRSVNYIPLNAATSILKLFLKKVDDANTNEELDSLFRSEEGPAFEQIVNLSQWGMHTPISIENKTLLMPILVYEELITKTDRQIKGLREGLKELEMYDIVKSNTEMFRTYFVYSKCEISAEQLLSLVEIEKAKGKGHDNILIWLEQFISDSSDKVAQMFLKFCTSFSVVPLTEDIEINVEFSKPDEGHFPKTAACTKKIRLPVIHETYDNFKKNMLKAFELECEGFADYSVNEVCGKILFSNNVNGRKGVLSKATMM